MVIQYVILLMTLDILEFSCEFYLIFNICSDGENNSYVTVSLVYITYNNYSAVGNVFLWGPLNYTCPHGISVNAVIGFLILW